MWLFTPEGFYSVVEISKWDKDIPEARDKELVVRARVGNDLKRFRKAYMPNLSPTVQLDYSDYRYRAFCTREDLADAMREIAYSIDYDNFKDTVRKRLSPEREHILHQVWSVMFRLQKPRTRRTRQAGDSRFGGFALPIGTPRYDSLWDDDRDEVNGELARMDKLLAGWDEQVA